MDKELSSKAKFKKIENIAQRIKILGHPYKLTIFRYLCNRGCKKMRVKEIYQSLGMQQATASRHLSEMKNHDLLIRSIENGKVYYQLNIGNGLVDCISQWIIKTK